MGSAPHGITTPRLLLRRWGDSDREPFAAMNVDPRVMEHFLGVMTREESDGFVNRILAQFEARGFGPWAVEVHETATFIGFVGLLVPNFDAHFMPAVEIGWRLAHDAWGHGYATEAARAVLDVAFNDLELEEVVSFTVVANDRSRRVMERIGMVHDEPGDFDHPRLPIDHPICRHVLYRISSATARP